MADLPNLPSADEQKQIDKDAANYSRSLGGDPPPAGGTPPAAQETYGDGAPAFAGYPITKFHPVYGSRSVNDPNEAAQVFQPPHNWFETAGAADAARTDREAQQVVFHNLQTKVAQKHAQLNGEEDPTANQDRQTIVRNSVQATESLNAGRSEPL
jgi:hypothetical protein